MNRIVVLCVLLVVGMLPSCSPESNAPATDGSTLIIEPDTIILAHDDSTKTLDLELTCGCGFTMEVKHAAGDTNVIKYAPIDDLALKLTKHQLQFIYSPSGCMARPYSVKLDFLAKKKTYVYTNSVVVEVK